MESHPTDESSYGDKSIAHLCINMFLKGFPLEAKTAFKI